MIEVRFQWDDAPNEERSMLSELKALPLVGDQVAIGNRLFEVIARMWRPAIETWPTLFLRAI